MLLNSGCQQLYEIQTVQRPKHGLVGIKSVPGQLNRVFNVSPRQGNMWSLLVFPPELVLYTEPLGTIHCR